jgi:hypothetical protein
MRVARALLVVFAVLAGCSGGGDDAGEDDPQAEGAADTSEPSETGDASGDDQSPACRLLTADEVGELFGQPAAVVPGEGEVAVATGSDTCLWEATSDDGPTATIHQLRLSVFTGDDSFDPAAWGDDPEAVDGLGDEAFLVRQGLLGTTAGYRQGDRSVFLSYAIPLGDAPPDTAAQADQVVDLLRTVDDRLAAPD